MIPSLSSPKSLPDDSSVDQRIETWIDLIDTTDELLRAGLRREVGPDGDLRTAYRQWSYEYRQTHDEAVTRMMATLRKLGG